MATLRDTTEPEPELPPDPDREANPDGTDGGVGTEGTDPVGTENPGDADAGLPPDTGGDGSDYSDGIDDIDNTVMGANTVVSAPEPAAQKLDPAIEYQYPFLYYFLEIRRGGGGWWSANQIIARLGQSIMPAPPQPEPVPGPAFRGGEPEPEQVLDASGGVGGGSDYQAGDFGGAPVLRAPVIAMPVPPAAAARFPSAPPAVAPGAGLTAARGTGAEPASTTSGVRPGANPQQPPAGTVTSMSGQKPRQGYTDFLRTAGLPQLAGAALPGVAGILLLTFGGAVIGYRQASAGRMVRMSGAARYLP